MKKTRRIIVDQGDRRGEELKDGCRERYKSRERIENLSYKIRAEGLVQNYQSE